MLKVLCPVFKMSLLFQDRKEEEIDTARVFLCGASGGRWSKEGAA